MSKPRNSRSVFVPPPLDGLNLIASPAEIKPTEARQLDNYFIYDDGIRQVPLIELGAVTGLATPIMTMAPFTDSAGQARMIFTSDHKFYLIDDPRDTKTDITGGSAIGSDDWTHCYFNGYLFFFNGLNVARKNDINTFHSAMTDFAPTGPAAGTLRQGTGYKGRLYVIAKSATGLLSSTYWYGGLLAISGTFTSIDLTSIFQFPGFLNCVFTWTVNQGTTNEEFLCFLSTSGELLVYSGDYPGSSTWNLLAKGKMPAPQGIECFTKVANDVYIRTVRGIIPITAVISSALKSDSYFSISRNIKDEVDSSIGVPTIDNVEPFYVTAGSDGTSLYCMNYERGAWSRLTFTDIAQTIDAYVFFNSILTISRNNTLYLIDFTAATDANKRYTWKTPYFDFGSNLQKESKLVRVLGNVDTHTSSDKLFAITASIATDFVEPTTAVEDSRSVAVPIGTNGKSPAVLEVAPPGVGHRLSYIFDRVGAATDGSATIQGFDAFFEDGGVY